MTGINKLLAAGNLCSRLSFLIEPLGEYVGGKIADLSPYCLSVDMRKELMLWREVWQH